MNPHILAFTGLIGAITGAAIPLILFYLSQRQKRFASEEKRFEPERERRDKNKKCNICDKPMRYSTPYTLPCNHEFHKKCLQDLFEQEKNKSTCPYINCRSPVPQSVVKEVLDLFP